MKKITIFVLVVVNCYLVLAKIPLQQAIKNGIRKNITIQNNLLEQKSLKLEKKNRDMQKWFALHMGGSYVFKSQQMEITFSDVQINEGISIPMEPIIVGAKHNYDLKLAITQPLFTGNILPNQAKLKHIQFEMEKNNTRLNTIEIITRIKMSYFSYRRLVSKLDSLKALLKSLTLHHKKLKDFYQEDLVKKSDLLETESRIQEQLLNLEEIRKLISQEKIYFKFLCDLNVEDINEDYREKIKTHRELVSYFKQNHPFLGFLNNQIQLFQIQKKITSGEYLPQLVGFAEIHYGRPGIDYFSNDWSFYFQGGVSFDLKLFNWNQRKRNLKILNYSVEKVKNKKKNFNQEAEQHLSQLFEAKKSAENRLEIIENLIRTSREEIELKKELFQEQQISNKDYLASFTATERYISMEKEYQLQVEIIKVNINKLIGILHDRFQEEI